MGLIRSGGEWFLLWMVVFSGVIVDGKADLNINQLIQTR